MSLETDLHAYLKANAGILAVATGGTYHVRRPIDSSAPCLVIGRGAGERGHDLSGGAGYAQPDFDLDCFATSFVTAKAIALAVRTALQGYKGTMGSTVVHSVIVSDETDLYAYAQNSSDVGMYHTALSATVLYQETIPTF